MSIAQDETCRCLVVNLADFDRQPRDISPHFANTDGGCLSGGEIRQRDTHSLFNQRW
jgi:hypothetical protein